MLVASAGGHLDELLIMTDVLGVPTEDALWVTSKNAHTESVLRGRDVEWLPRVGSGETAKAVSRLPAAFGLQKRIRPKLLVSTGALFAAPHLLAAHMAGCESWFVESATRGLGPSATGRFVQRFTRAKLFVQSPGWGDPRWTTVRGVFDAFESVTTRDAPPGAPHKVVVSLGSELWTFDRAVRKVLQLLPDAQVTWQTGVTVHEVGGTRLRQWVPADELRSAIANADVVITHAGVGSILACLDNGKVPIILPRRAAQHEHVDDHQVQFAEMLGERGLAINVDPDELNMSHLAKAKSLIARRV